MVRSDHFRTPPNIYNPLNREFNFTLDPCPINGRGGLSRSWDGETVFVNPPFSNIEPWVKKAWIHSQKGEAIVVMLLPSRTDQQWFIEYVWPYADIRWIRGHVHFHNADGSKCKWNFREACFIAIFRYREEKVMSESIDLLHDIRTFIMDNYNPKCGWDCIDECDNGHGEPIHGSCEDAIEIYEKLHDLEIILNKRDDDE